MKKLWMLMSFLLVLTTAAVAASSLPFIEDDYAKALATAKQRKLPLFIEVSAPW